MKFIDKFVLVPIERYERLTKMQSFSNEENNVKKEVITYPKGKESTESNINNNLLQKEDNKNSVKESSTITESQSNQEISPAVGELDKAKKTPKKRKIVPAPPPGIPNLVKKKKKSVHVLPPGVPNKIKKVDFHWYSPFKQK